MCVFSSFSLSICFQDLIWHSSTHISLHRRIKNHLFPIEFNLKFHLIKSLLYVIFKFQRCTVCSAFIKMVECGPQTPKPMPLHSIIASCTVCVFLVPHCVYAHAHTHRSKSDEKTECMEGFVHFIKCI